MSVTASSPGDLFFVTKNQQNCFQISPTYPDFPATDISLFSNKDDFQFFEQSKSKENILLKKDLDQRGLKYSELKF